MSLKKLVFLFLLFPCIAFAQDPGYSQFFANPLHLNPAFAGTSELPRLVFNYRNQWPQQGNSFTTYAISYDFLLKKRNAGLGFQAYHDREPNNIITSSSATLAYSYHLQLGKESFMTLGLNAGVVVKQFDTNSLIFPSEIDQLTGTISNSVFGAVDEVTKSYPDFAFGAVGQHRSVFWGASVHHLNTPNESIYEGDNKGKVPMKVTLHAGARLHRFHHDLLSRRFTLSPNVLYQQQGSFKQLNLGIYMIEKSVLFGAWFRNNIDTRPDALIALIGFVRNKFQFGYSFDYTLSELSNYSHGSHEFSLTFFIGSKGKTPIRNKLLIPTL
ncbi:type IX secretion system membrane protein PorP/SprF [uncultured Draconibacterium sp.]|uniref:PorP/SprF family type IX secretion system membrane protein n=1 Tax=uncultured Draconibacterium sp. TaxID=1573823 RepID=UPI0025FAF8B1|nr:type IX secretion system membrane protein PorP/SprF [uncultured Draconibacterium sp.]